MVLDAAKGIEPQTLKLFEVCKARGLPLAFINSGTDPSRASRAHGRDRATNRLVCSPISWPVGIAGDFRGVIDRRSSEFIASPARPGRHDRARELVDMHKPPRKKAASGRPAQEELQFIEGVTPPFDPRPFLRAR